MVEKNNEKTRHQRCFAAQFHIKNNSERNSNSKNENSKLDFIKKIKNDDAKENFDEIKSMPKSWRIRRGRFSVLFLVGFNLIFFATVSKLLNAVKIGNPDLQQGLPWNRAGSSCTGFPLTNSKYCSGA
jgi:hypothetical protein